MVTPAKEVRWLRLIIVKIGRVNGGLAHGPWTIEGLSMCDNRVLKRPFNFHASVSNDIQRLQPHNGKLSLSPSLAFPSKIFDGKRRSTLHKFMAPKDYLDFNRRPVESDKLCQKCECFRQNGELWTIGRKTIRISPRKGKLPFSWCLILISILDSDSQRQFLSRTSCTSIRRRSRLWTLGTYSRASASR